jgi:hypothetical protein
MSLKAQMSDTPKWGAGIKGTATVSLGIYAVEKTRLTWPKSITFTSKAIAIQVAVATTVTRAFCRVLKLQLRPGLIDRQEFQRV